MITGADGSSTTPASVISTARQSQSVAKPPVGSEVVSKRTKRHLDELERSNYAEPSGLYAGVEDDEEETGKTAKGRARQTISDKRNISAGGPGAKRKKSTMNVRTAILYRKRLAELIEESRIADFPATVPTYLTAAAAPPKEPPRMLCSVWSTRRDEMREACDMMVGFIFWSFPPNLGCIKPTISGLASPLADEFLPFSQRSLSSPLSQPKEMCPPTNSESLPNGNGEMVGIEMKPNGVKTNGHVSDAQRRNPGESTLTPTRAAEGEQFANAFFDTKTKIAIAKALDSFGVEYIELTSPAASEQSRADCEAICKLGLKAKILTHIRCHMDDARIAVETGVDGVDVVIGTSSFLREFSHGKDMTYITKTAIEVINFVKSKGIEVRFSTEDSFRSDLVDLLSIYQTVDKIGVNRVGIADTVGGANPRQVYDLVRTLRGVVGCDIEIHLHNDTGMAIANAYTALEAGATHVDTSVLGIGERVGITSLGGLVACMYAANPEYVKAKYNLPLLREIENLVAEAVEVNVPFMNPITYAEMPCSTLPFSNTPVGFTRQWLLRVHAQGRHPRQGHPEQPQHIRDPQARRLWAHALRLHRVSHRPAFFLPDPSSLVAVPNRHRLTGWNAVKSRVEQLGLTLTDDEIKDATAKIKELADVRTQSMDDVDSLLRVYHSGIQSGALAVGQKEALDRLLREHRAQRDGLVA
ncbi:hypothetical protein EW146_g2814 [Bondarzewia mesenterica]|uniref:Pyruvate carboxyltransferase domain-containing protein n=1 Tax=Bondarzewia mesenterica TaxID=1095465 RepID=A0A4S4LZS8_9AGAM|nr:hypothetical protein EW146_g2814 [Bondarzewia mesenterica]